MDLISDTVDNTDNSASRDISHDTMLYQGSRILFRSVGVRTSIRVFFVQAEDGIRDLTVTGVQTCALPIYAVDFVTNVLEASTEYSIIGKALDGKILLWNEGA